MSSDERPGGQPTLPTFSEASGAPGAIETPAALSPKHATQMTPEDKKIKSLEATIAKLQTQISETESLLAETREKLSIVKSPNEADPAAIVKRHIRLLHEYNEIKDIGHGLMGLIADARGVRHVDVQSEFGVGSKD